MVLHQLVGLKRVGADLAAEADLRLSLVELPSLFPALGELMLVQTRAKDLHGHLAVFVLAALVLALHYNAGGEVRDSHSGVGNVDVLAAMTTGAEGVDAQVFGFDDDFNLVVNFRYHKNGRKRSVPPRGLVERRNADKPVHAALGGEQSVSVFALEARGG